MPMVYRDGGNNLESPLNIAFFRHPTQNKPSVLKKKKLLRPLENALPCTTL